MKNNCKYIMEAEIALIERIACDLQTGNHLLRPRDEAYWEYWNKMVEARNNELNGHADDKQKEMCEYERQCSDYFYWKHLPNDKKLFFEDDEI